MVTTLLVTRVLFVTALMAIPIAEVKTSVASLDGKWVTVSVEREGKTDDTLTGAERVHQGNEYTMTPKSGVAVKGQFSLDESSNPKAIDMKPAGGRYKGQTLKGIYKIDGDKLTVCFAEPGKDRPSEFSSGKAGTGLVLAVYERAK